MKKDFKWQFMFCRKYNFKTFSALPLFNAYIYNTTLSGFVIVFFLSSRFPTDHFMYV